MSGFVQELRQGNNPLVARIAALAALGGLLFGYDTGVISGALLYLKDELHADNFAQQAIVAGLLLGAVAGAVAAGHLAERISRKWTLVAAGAVYVIGALGCALAGNVPTLVAFRFILGLAVGTASFVGPMYISEMAPPQIRGGLTSFNQLAITVGILLSYIVNFALKDVSHNWRWMLGAALLPGVVLVLGMLTVPRTPRWLVEHDREPEARSVLEKVRAGNPSADVETELDEIRTVAAESRETRLRDLFAPALRPLMFIGLGLAIAQQFVGINTVIYYAPTILTATGKSAGGAIGQTVFIGLTNVIFTVVAVMLMDRLGRRTFLIAGTVGTLVGLVLLGLYFGIDTLQNNAPWLALGALLIYIASFAVGLGPVFWLMISEIFPLRIRSAAMSASTVGNWAANFVVSFTFLTLVATISRPGTFFLYAGINLLALIFFMRAVPETTGRSLEQLQHELAPTQAEPVSASRPGSRGTAARPAYGSPRSPRTAR